MIEDFPCSICGEQVYIDGIFCNSCEMWVHFKCNHLNQVEIDSLVDSDDSEPWACIKCNINALNYIDNSCEYYDSSSFISKNFDHKSLSFMHLNISSCDKHFDNFHTFLHNLKFPFDIIGLTETRIKSESIDFPIEELEPFHTPTEADAGGTSLYISVSYKPTRRQDLESLLYISKTLESTFAEFSRCSFHFVVGTIYKHPFMKIPDFILKLGQVLDKVSSEGKILILLGDFNVDLLKFDKDPNIFKFLDTLSSYSLKPYINIPTRITENSRSIIDNIYISSIPFNAHSGNFLTGISDHLIQFTILNSVPAKSTDAPKTGFYKDWKNFNSSKFSNDFNKINWKNILQLDKKDPELSFQIFYKKLNNLLNVNVPFKKLTKKQIKRGLKPWVTKGILKSMSLRDRFLKKYINSKNLDLKSTYHIKYKRYRNSITNLLRVSKKLYYQNFFNTNSNDTKKTWEGINQILNKKKCKTQPSISLTINDKTESKPSVVSNEFNRFFSTIASTIQSNIPNLGNFESYVKKLKSPNSFFFSPVSKPEILKILNSLDHDKSNGEFSIPWQVFDSVPDSLAEILQLLINLTFETGIFPSALKIVKVIPIFKNKGSNQDVNNYRPISLLSNIDKIFEKLVYVRLSSFLEVHNVLSNRQFGFRKNYSTKLALISLTEEIRRSLDEGNFSCGVFIDLQKAFDTVEHKILLRKLELYGVRGIANKWFQSYLSDRIQYVSYSGAASNKRRILTGVPQGSVLGPLLFLIYINDLCNAVCYSKTSLFADDTSIVYSDVSLKNIETFINLDLNNLYVWLCANKISLNVAKTKILLFRNVHKKITHNLNFEINGKEIKLSESVKYLGVTLDHLLNWNLNTKILCSKLTKANGAISKLRHFVSRSTLIQIYYALFFSHLNYACQIWGQSHNSNLERIFKLQKRCVRLITFSEFNAHSSPLFLNLNVLKISDVIKLRNISLVQEILTGKSPPRVSSVFSLSYYQHGHLTRGSSNYLLSRPTFRTSSYGINSITYRSILNWNELQKHHPESSLSSFSKSKLKSTYHKLAISQYFT